MTIPKLKDFLRQHALGAALVAVAIPLLAHLWQQYQSLAQLEATMPYKRKAWMRQYLYNVIEKVTTVYEQKADEVLSVPASAFNQDYENPAYDSQSAIDLVQVSDYFMTHPFNGARLLFVGTISSKSETTYASVRFYDPIACSFRYRATPQERSAAHAAAANWMAMIMVRSWIKSVQLTVDERDPANRIIVKPIVDAQRQLVGVAGMFLNERVFLNNYLAPALNEALPGFFPDEHRDAIATVINDKEKLLYQNQPFEGKAYEVAWRLRFIFTDWHAGLRMRHMTEEELSRRNFLIGLSFSLLTALVLIGGIVLALRSASRAMRLSQMKADFVSNVSHELRTPLASIRVFGEFLKLGRVTEPGKIREYGEYIETESRRLTQLINNILDFSKIESGQKTYQFEPAHVEQVVADTLKTFEIVLEQQGFTANFDKPAQPLPAVVIDHEAIAQALINLLDNAVKYSGPARQVDVKLGQHDGFITIAVRDHGIGIAQEDCEKVFEKFFRVGNSLVHDVKGSGLGLSIVKHIVEAHRGKVTVESEPGRGSTFIIHLPVSDGKTAKPEPSNESHALKRGLRMSNETSH